MAAVANPLLRPESSASNDSNSHNSGLLHLLDSCATGLFGPCEDTCQQASRSVFWEPATSVLQSTDNSQNNVDRVRCLGFEALHDQFLESLLHEAATMEEEPEEGEDDETSLTTASKLLRRGSTNSLSSLDLSFKEPPRHQPENPKQRKRRRPMRLTRRRTPPRLRKIPSPLSSSDQNSHASGATDYSRASSASVTISLIDLSQALDRPDPATFLHELVRLQKDKGKGEPVGSNLCAKGREACLSKLREKMRLLTQVATEKSTGASMKIRKARIAQRVENFVETRSLINLRMGFLSITYGILLRWDTTKTGTITLVCLRKMCHESFYPSQHVPRTVSAGLSSSSTSSLASGSMELARSRTSINTAEFTQLDPPYCVPRPMKFPTDAVLMVSLVSVTGLSKKSNWTAQLAVGSYSENMHLQWDVSKRYMSPRDDCAFSMPTSQRIRWGASSEIQIKLFETRIRRRIPGRVACSMSLPLQNLRPQSSPARFTRVTVPCSHDEDACVVLDVAWQSDFAVWAAREVYTRRQAPEPTEEVTPAEEPENHDPWDWICHVC